MENTRRFSESKHIKNQTYNIANERLDFLDGKCLGDVDIFIESGATDRKIRRIVEKRVSQHLYRKGKFKIGNGSRYNAKHRSTNQLKNIFGGVPEGFVYYRCA